MIWYLKNSYDRHLCTRGLQHVRDVDAWNHDEELRRRLLAIVTASGQRRGRSISTDTFCRIQDQIISPNAESDECESIGRRKRKTGLNNRGSCSRLYQSCLVHFVFLNLIILVLQDARFDFLSNNKDSGVLELRCRD